MEPSDPNSTIVRRQESDDPFCYDRWLISIQRPFLPIGIERPLVLRPLADRNPTIRCHRVVAEVHSSGCDSMFLRHYAADHRAPELVLNRLLAFRRMYTLSGHRQVIVTTLPLFRISAPLIWNTKTPPPPHLTLPPSTVSNHHPPSSSSIHAPTEHLSPAENSHTLCGLGQHYPKLANQGTRAHKNAHRYAPFAWILSLGMSSHFSAIRSSKLSARPNLRHGGNFWGSV